MASGLVGFACEEAQKDQTGSGSGSDDGGAVEAPESVVVDVVDALAAAAVAEAAWRRR